MRGVECKSPGKHPRLSGWKEWASTEKKEIEHLFKSYPDSNVSIATGKGILVVDIDDATSELAQELLPMLPATLSAITGREGGMHRYYRREDSSRLTTPQFDGIDVRSDGGQVVAPPSLHYSGRRYAWVEPPSKVGIAELPDEVMDFLVEKHKARRKARKAQAVTPGGALVREGERHQWLMDQIFRRAVSGRMSREELEAVVVKHLVPQCENGDDIDREEISNLIDGAFARKQVWAMPFEMLTEIGLSERLAEYWDGEALCLPDGKWWGYVADTGLWERLYTPEKLVVPMREAIYDATLNTCDEDNVGLVKKWYADSSTQRSLSATVKLSRADMMIEEADFSVADGVLPFQNGVYEMDTGAFREACPEDYIREPINAEYVPNAKCPKWIETLKLVTGGDKETMRYHQQVFGYMLGSKTMRGIWYFVGPKYTSKTTLVGVLAKIMGGKLAGTVQKGLIHAEGRGTDEEFARVCLPLIGRRFVYMDETLEKSVVDAGKFKQIASVGPMLTARKLRQDAMTFENKAKVIVMTNFPPKIDAGDDAAWERVRFVPYLNSIPAEKRRDSYGDELFAEASGILNWCLEGYRDYLKNGFVVPKLVEEQIAAASWHKQQAFGELGEVKSNPAFSTLIKRVLHPQVKSVKSNGQRWLVGITVKDHIVVP
jgi:putative DNA primase/helicase